MTRFWAIFRTTFLQCIRQPIYGVLLLVMYGLGHCSVIVLAGTSTELVQRYMNWNEKSKGALILKKVCGALILLAGLYMIWRA